MDECEGCGRVKIMAMCFKNNLPMCKDCCIKSNDGISKCDYYKVCW